MADSHPSASSACHSPEAQVDESLRDFSLSFASLPGALAQRGPDVHWCYTGAPRLNRVLSARFHEGDADRRIDEVLAVFRSRAVPASWYVSPLDTPADLAARLECRGLVLRGIWTGMTFDLDEGVPSGNLPDDAEVRPADDEAGAIAWAETAGVGFAMPPDSAGAFVRVISLMRPPAEAVWRRYITYWRGEPVATAALYVERGIAGIYYVGTVPSARRHGFASAATLRALADARTLGHRSAVLQASPAGAPVYLRLGFRQVSAIGLYDYHP